MLRIMDVNTVSEQLFFATVHIRGSASGGISTGTGFVYAVETDRGPAHFLVSNKHVFDGCVDSMEVQMVAAAQDGKPAFGTAATMQVSGVPGGRGDHPDPDVDVAVLPFSGVLEAMHSQGQAPFFRSIPSSIRLNDEIYSLVDAIEEVTFLGYPDSIFDSHNFTPVARTGTTATPITLDFNGKPQFLIDASVFPGSSGSPVFLLDRGGSYQGKDGGVHIGFRFALLGVLHAVRVRQIQAAVELLPTAVAGVRLADPLNLGVVFKAQTIDECIDPLLDAAGVKRTSGAAAAPADALSPADQDVADAVS